MIDGDRRAAIESLFDVAVELAPAARGQWLDGACGGDPILRDEVEQLLHAHERSDGILDGTPQEFTALLATDAEELPSIAERLGPYRLVREIGRGGMGRVFLGVRDDAQFEQRVAIKVLHVDYSSEVVDRFLAERQILASLEHPNIARLLDGGLTSDGRPYAVMEFVEGAPLDVYCDARRLSIDDRLRLFCKIAAAVHYAHRNLVVHRDIKPSNILIGPDGEPKLLDFGIAKMLDPDNMPYAAPRTDSGVRLMTPEYASPEQVQGVNITTAVDIYALGLVLYELLCGRRAQRREGEMYAELYRRILHEEPPLPSVAVFVSSPRPSNGEMRILTPESVAHARRSTPQQLHRKLRGDLDRIVHMALRKEPTRRYASADELARDLERYLVGLPVRARGDSVNYRVRKFVGRHRLLVGTIGAFVLMLAVYAGTITIQARRISAALEQARLEAEKADEMASFTIGLFEAEASPRAGDAFTVDELLSAGAERAEQLRRQPAAQAQMLDVIGRAHQRLGHYPAALPFLEQALEIRRERFGPDHAATAESESHLGALMFAQGHYAEADSLYRSALATQRQVLGEWHPALARTLEGLGMVLQARGDYAGAVRLSREALAMRRRLLGDRHLEVARSYHALAFQVQLLGRAEEAESLYLRSLAIRRELLGDEHPDVAATLSSLGLLRFQREDLAGADSLYARALAMRRRLLGGSHPDVAVSVALLGALRRRQGALQAAETLYREAIDISRHALGSDHPDVVHHENGLALVLRGEKRFTEAESLYRHVLDARRRTLGPEHPSLATTLSQLGALLIEEGRLSEAEPLLLEALAIRRRVLDDRHPQVLETVRELVTLYERTNQPDRAREYRAMLSRG